MARLSLSLLGGFQVTLDGKPVTGFHSSKVQGLLAYLAVESGRLHRREMLAALLWPDVPDTSARANLRKVLSDLRRAIGDRETPNPALLVSRETIQFNNKSDCRVDVTVMESLTTAHATTKQRADAVSLYKGRFLEGFSIHDSVAYDDWTRQVSDHLQRRISTTLRHLVDDFEAADDLAQARTYAWRRVELEPWHEDAHRQLMRILALSDQRTAALAQYEACRENLQRAFDVEPSPRTQQLYAQIRDGLLMAAAPGTSPRPIRAEAEYLIRNRARALAPPVFVARERELAQLTGHLDRALGGEGRVVFVTGEAGQGKTALVQAFAHRALADYPTLIPACGDCNAYTGIGDPYLPFREILAMLTGDLNARSADIAITEALEDRLEQVFPTFLQALLTEGKDLIGALIPEHALKRQAVAYAQNVDAQAGQALLAQLNAFLERQASTPRLSPMQQQDLFRQYTQVLQAVAQHNPLLLILDDLQWADQGSINLLFHLGRQLTSRPILVAGAYRSEEVAMGRGEARHPLVPVLNEFARLWGDTRVDLDRAEGRRFVDALIDTEPNQLGRAFRETLYDQTQGHPLFTVELLRGMQDRGDLVQDDEGSWREGPVLDWETLPARVEAVIAERVARLDRADRALLRSASVEGEVFTAEVLAHVHVLEPHEVITTLSGALARHHRLVRAQGLQSMGRGQLSRYRFRHILFQKYLYSSTDPVERAHLHGEVYHALAALHADESGLPQPVLPALALHAEQAGRVKPAIEHYRQAGQWALHVSANEEAVNHFSRALELVEQLPDRKNRMERELALQLDLAVPLIALQSWGAPEVGEAYQRALTLSKTLGDTPQLMRALDGVRSYHNVRSEYLPAMELAEEYYRRSQELADPLHTMFGTGPISIVSVFAGAFEQSLNYGRALITHYDPAVHGTLMYRMGQDPAVVVKAFMVYDLWYLGYPDQALQMAEASFAYATALDHPFSLNFALDFKSRLHRWRREPELVEASVDTQRKLWSDHEMQLAHAGLMLDSAWVKAQRGDLERAIAEYQEGLTTWTSAGMTNHLTEFWSVLAEMHAQAGHVQQALDLLAATIDRIEATGERYHEAEVYRLRSEIRLQKDPEDVEGADADLRHALEVAVAQKARMLELRAAMGACRLWADRDDTRAQEAVTRLAAVYGWFTEGFDTRDLREAKTLSDAMSSRG